MRYTVNATIPACRTETGVPTVVTSVSHPTAELVNLALLLERRNNLPTPYEGDDFIPPDQRFREHSEDSDG